MELGFALEILNRNGIDFKYLINNSGIEFGGEEWVDTVSDLIGKNAYEDDMSEEDSKLINEFIKVITDYGIELW